MKELFRIKTNLFSLVWERRAKQDPPILAERTSVTGRLILSKRSPQLQFLESNWRSGVPARLESDPSLEIGPPIYEQSDYQIYLKSRNDLGKIRLQHRDPNILQGLSYQENDRVLHGTINFRNQIGRSLFTICVDGSSYG